MNKSREGEKITMTSRMTVKTYSADQDTEDMLAELHYILRIKVSAIIRAAIHDYYHKVIAEKLAEKEATK